MHTDGRTRVAIGMVIAGLLLLAPSMPAQAGLFERIFGGLSRALGSPDRLPGAIREFAPPFEPRSERAINPSGEVEGGPARAFCVRTCDGHFFPVTAHAGMSAADACHAFCPASQTAIYTGSSIDNAVAPNGSHYADLPRAFLYRKQLIGGCTCNGRDQFGLAHLDVNKDPTLVPGDVAATSKGMAAFTGWQNRTAQFTRAGSYARFSRQYRSQLSAIEKSVPR